MGQFKKGLFILGGTCGFILAGFIMAIIIIKIDHYIPPETNKLSTLSQKTNDQEKSLVYLQEAALINPNENTYLLAGVKAEELGLDKISTYYLSRVKTANGYLKLGQAYFNGNQFNLANSALQRSIRIKDNNSAELMLGKIELKNNRLHKAAVAFDRAEKLNQKDVETNYYFSLVSLMNRNDDYQRTAIYLTGQYQTDISSIVQYSSIKTRNNLIFNLLKTTGYPQVALSFLQSAASHDNVDRDGYLLLAEDYFFQKNYQKSYQFLLQARNLDPYYPQTYKHLIEVTGYLGLKTEAASYQEFYNNLVYKS